MSAADWRRAMNVQRTQVVGVTTTAPRVAGDVRVRRFAFENPVRPRHVLVLAFLVAYPWLATPFFTYQIGAQALALGLIALSLTFLGGAGSDSFFLALLRSLCWRRLIGHDCLILGFLFSRLSFRPHNIVSCNNRFRSRGRLGRCWLWFDFLCRRLLLDFSVN